jgi:hypothetical protein
MVKRYTLLSLLACALVGWADRAADPSRPAPLFVLPADGVWVEFDWKAAPLDGREQAGTLRLSSVGRTESRDAPHRWVEIKKEVVEKDQTHQQVRKLLVAEKVVADGTPLPGHVAEGYGRDRAGGPVLRLSPARLDDLVGLGLPGPGADFQEVRDKETVENKLGKFVTRHVTASGKRGDRTLTFHFWLTDQLPFGWARLEVRERSGTDPPRLVFTAVAARQGQGAKSDLDESTAR